MFDDDYIAGFVDAIVLFAPLKIAAFVLVALIVCWLFQWWPF